MELTGMQRHLVAFAIAVVLFLLTGPLNLDSLRLHNLALAHGETSTSDIARGHNDGFENYSHPFNPESYFKAPRRRNLDTSDKPLTDEQKEAAFQRYRCRGQRLLKDLRDPTKAKHAAFTKSSDLDAWGWRINDGPAGMRPEWYTEILSPSFDAIGASKATPPNVDKRWIHKRESTHPDGGHDPTLALYNNIVNAKDGVIIAYEVVQHSNFDEESITDEHNRSGLKHIFRENIVNKDSCAIAEKGAKSKEISNGATPAYSGIKYMRSKNAAEQAAFEALVGYDASAIRSQSTVWLKSDNSPNVNGVAWLFIQHAEALGHKTMKSITVWDPTPGKDKPTSPDLTRSAKTSTCGLRWRPWRR
ncbi:hypothetical protein LTR95_006849 [Oleoguttula sp. CCFEE 5521]